MSRSAGWLLEPDRRGGVPLAVAVVLVVTFLCGSLASLHALDGLTRQITDLSWPTGPVDERLLIVELPVESLDWGRERHAALIDRLAAGGAAVIGYDAVFSGERQGTDELVRAVAAAGNVVLVSSASFEVTDASDLPRVAFVTEPLPALAAAARVVAHANVQGSNVDLQIRSVPLVAERPDRRTLPAIALAMVQLLEGVDPGTTTVGSGGGVFVGPRLIPTDDRFALEVNWSWRWSQAQDRMPDGLVLSERDVLAGAGDYDGRAVLVGVASTLVDHFPTPVNRVAMPGLHIHAAAVNTMLTNLYREAAAPWSVVAWIFLLSSLVAASGVWLRLAWVPVVALGLMAAWQARVDLAFQTGLGLDPFWPQMAILGSAVGVVSVRYVRQRREREKVAGLFRQYVPDEVVTDLLASGTAKELADGRRVEVTVLFSDLRGFTATAATLEPADVRALLEVYYDHATAIIHDHGGTVMQFVGDEVFAVFGAPVAQSDHAQRAVDAARALQAAAPQVNRVLAPRGIEVAWGIGVNTGEVVAAHVGSKVHKQYAVVGQAVNVGARLCSQAGPGEVVLSRWTRDRLARPVAFESLGKVELKGVARDPEPARLLR